jgi:hypothetical protein
MFQDLHDSNAVEIEEDGHDAQNPKEITENLHPDLDE